MKWSQLKSGDLIEHDGEITVLPKMLKYCDRCKWDSVRCSKGIPDGKSVEEMKECPDCGNELYEARSLDDIP
jgi:hypothetical protein